jgi:hypothetical protein
VLFLLRSFFSFFSFWYVYNCTHTNEGNDMDVPGVHLNAFAHKGKWPNGSRESGEEVQTGGGWLPFKGMQPRRPLGELMEILYYEL